MEDKIIKIGKNSRLILLTEDSAADIIPVVNAGNAREYIFSMVSASK